VLIHDDEIGLASQSVNRMMSALPPKADIAEDNRHVRFGPINGLMHCNKNKAAYSITSSASESTLFGIVKFIAFAVFKLMTNR
jgi:hypothetical protein